MSAVPMPTLDELKATDRLPSPQGVALEIVRLTRGDNFTNAQLAHIVQADPALCGRLLRAANSVALGGRRPVASVNEAILVLGVPTVRQLVLGFSLVSRYKRGSCPGFDYQAFWARSLLLGVAAQTLSKHVRGATGEEMFACGLLADIGALALATVYPERYSEVLQSVPAGEREALLACERDDLGIDHVVLGAAMLEDWCFPSLFVSAVRARIAPQDAGFAEGSRLLNLARSFQLAESLAALSVLDEDERALRLPDVLLDAARLAVDGEDLEVMMDVIQREWREWMLILDVPQSEDAKLESAPPPKIGDHAAENPVLSPAMRLRILEVGVKHAAIAELEQQAKLDGHSIASAQGLKQAVATVLSTRPHVVIVSLDLPQDEGLHLIQALRTLEVAAQCYILALAGAGQESKALGALSRGADDVLHHPFAAAMLVARLRAAQRMLGQQVVLARSLEELRKFSRELAVNNRRLQQQLHTDELTGLPNMRYCRERLDQAWAVLRRRAGDLAVLVVDLDNFKQVNDRCGHVVGDELLCRTGMILRGLSRLQDVVCRTGGSDFTLICPDTGADEARQFAERLRLAIAEESADASRGIPEVTVSIGIALADTEICESAEMLRRAGHSLNRAKSLGRNRAYLWEAN